MGTPQTATPSSPTLGGARRLLPTRRQKAQQKPLPERVPWETLGPDFYKAWCYPKGRWQPEHLCIVGPTGSGKSWFEKTILQERARLRGSHIVIVATKPADATLTSLGWPIVTSWPPKKEWGEKRQMNQVIYWARADGLNDEGRTRQKAMVEDLLSKLWKPDSNIIVCFDEIAYLEQELKLKTQLQTYYREARANGITIVANTQRPSGVNRYMWSESTWSVAFRPKDDDDAKRVAQQLGNEVYYARVFDELDRGNHEFVLVHNLTQQAYISSIPATSGGHDIRPKREPVDKPQGSV